MKTPEVAVIGGGITGVSLLHWLGQAGKGGMLLERTHLGAGASGRNAGFLIAGIAANYHDAVATYGRELAREVWNFTVYNHGLMREAVAHLAVGYRRRGSWTLAASEAEADALRKSEALMRKDGLDATWTTDIPYDKRKYPGGLLNPGDGEVDATGVLRALTRPLPRASIQTGVWVERIHDHDGGVHLHTSAGKLFARQVVVASNAYARELLPDVPIEPVRGQMLATEPVGRVVAERPVYANYGYQYWRQLEDGALVLGGWRDTALEEEVGVDDLPTDRIQGQLDAHLRTLGVDAPVARRWAGIMGFTPDRLPVVGRVAGKRNIFVCGGYSGHGLNFAFNCARLLVQHIVHGDALPGWTDPARFSAGSGSPAAAATP